SPTFKLIRNPNAIVDRPQVGTIGGIARAVELASDPGAVVRRAVLEHAPWPAAGEAVDRVLAGGIGGAEGRRLAVPGEDAAANPVGEGKEDRDAAARRRAAGKELRVGVEQLDAADAPAKAVAALARPDLGHRVVAFENPYVRIQAETRCPRLT